MAFMGLWVIATDMQHAAPAFPSGDLFVKGIVDEIDERLQKPEQSCSPLRPVGIDEEIAGARTEFAVVGHAQVFGLRMVAIPAFGNGFDCRRAPSREFALHFRRSHNLFPFLDVVHDGVTHLFEHRTFQTPDSAVEALIVSPGYAGLDIISGMHRLASPRADRGREVGLIGSLVVGKTSVTINTVGR